MAAKPENVLTVLVAEGPTEEIFYGRVKEAYLAPVCSVKIECIDGLWGVNKKILHVLATRNRERQVRAYCCLDRESRRAQVPDFDPDGIQQELCRKGVESVLSVDSIIATRMIESLFFYDLEGIYKYLRVPKAKRNSKAYQPPEAFGVEDLKELFRRFGKSYQEGERARHFINQLDLPKIVASCGALSEGIELIVSRAGR